ncbi:hypothetical protein ZWY2020_000090 [Hordeum vulgare]|nr:hypothetical protein ZWY2020_000090 [Hordeum vulgare]
MIPKRPRVDDCERNKRRQHLYLVSDDWSRGYIIRKVNPWRRRATVRRIPRPFLRFEARPMWPDCFPATFGTMFLSMNARIPPNLVLPTATGPEPASRSWAFAHGPSPLALGWNTTSIPSISLSAMISCSVHYVPQLLRGALHGLIWRRHGVVVAIAPGAAAFGVYDVSSYAVHPDGRSFLVSTKREEIVASLVFDMEELSWKHLGNWALPFDCRRHFDPLLGTLVRLFDHIFLIFLGQYSTPGPPTQTLDRSNVGTTQRKKKHTRELEVEEGSHNTQHQREKNTQSLVHTHLTTLGPTIGLYRLTTFSLNHDMNGDLTTNKSRQVQYYKVPVLQQPVAFWM